MIKEIRILIADDHQIVSDGLKNILKDIEGLKVVASASNGEEAVEICKTLTIDIVLMDIDMPKLTGIEATKLIKAQFSNIKVLVLSMHNEKQIISEILLAEAEGYVLKNTGKEELLKAISTIKAGDTFNSKEVLKLMLQSVTQNTKKEDATKDLTERELEIIHYIVQEYSTAEIAELLFISPRTVETHRKNIMQKLDTKTIVGLMKFAFRNNLIP